MREVLRRKAIVATSLCAGPHRVGYVGPRQPAVPVLGSGPCLCGSATRHCGQFSRCASRREHLA